jgi:hypothetical protein
MTQEELEQKFLDEKNWLQEGEIYYPMVDYWYESFKKDFLSNSGVFARYREALEKKNYSVSNTLQTYSYV